VEIAPVKVESAQIAAGAVAEELLGHVRSDRACAQNERCSQNGMKYCIVYLLFL
jgi:hypothetical protein